MLASDVIPVVPAQGSVGASGDLAPLAHMTAAMIGVGECFTPHGRVPAAEALRGGRPGAGRRSAPRKAWRCSTARSSRPPMRWPALFEAEVLFQSALVTGALSTDAAKGSDAPFDPRIHALRRHRGQIETADALRALMAGSAIRDIASRRRRARAGPVLPALPAAGDGRRRSTCCARPPTTLATEANGVTDNPLIFAEDDTALSGGNFHAEPVAFAADMIALAVCEIGSLAERRIAMLVDPALSGLPAFLTPKPGLNSGFMIPQVTAAALVSENKQTRLSGQRRFDPDLGQPGRPCLDGRARRAPAAADGRERDGRHRHRAAGRGAGLRFPRAADVQRAARGRARAAARARCRISTTTAISIPTWRRPSRWCAPAR